MVTMERLVGTYVFDPELTAGKMIFGRYDERTHGGPMPEKHERAPKNPEQTASVEIISNRVEQSKASPARIHNANRLRINVNNGVDVPSTRSPSL